MSQDWQNISDDDLDDFFRNAAEEQNIAFDADSWKKMNEKLDALPSPKEENRWKRALPLLLLLLLLSFVGGYFVMNRSAESDKMVEYQTEAQNTRTQSATESSRLNQNAKNQIKNTPDTEIGVNAEAEKKEAISAETKAKNSIEAVQNTSSEMNDKAFRNKSVNRSSTKQNTKVIVAFSNKNTDYKVTKQSEFVSKQIIEKTNKSTDNQVIAIENSSITTENSTNNTNISTNETSIEETLKKTDLANLNDMLAKKPIFKNNLAFPLVSFESDFKPKPMPLSSASFKKGFNIRLNVSPDVSTVAFNEIRKVGTNLGALIEYRFNNRWSFQTGLIRSLKIYEAYPEQYTWVWKMPNTPLLDINATCKMFDIPLNIRYDITQKAKSRWFVGAGVTTYRMLEETYIYNYENNNDPSIKWKKWVGSSGSYPFKVINISSGYEKEFRRNLTFQVEPFVKIPTAKVGFGKVNLSTIGVFLSAKYHIGK